MKRLHLITLLLLACSGSAFAQQAASIRGTVTNAESKEPLSYINVALEGTIKGGSTTINGTYQITNIKPGSYTLAATAVGYQSEKKSITISAGEQLVIDFRLNKSVSNMNEVTVSASRRTENLDEVTTSVTVVDNQQLSRQETMNSNVQDMLANTVPGLGPGTNTTSNTGQTLRGRNMVVMVDGIPQSTPLRSGGRDVRTIDPGVLQRIEVIKGATSLYGSNAEGGFINYITLMPTENDPLRSQTTLSNTGLLVEPGNTMGGQVAQQFSGKINELSYVVQGRYEQTGVKKDANGEVLSPRYGLGETDIVNTFGKVGYELNPDNRIEAMFNFYSSRQKTKYKLQAGHYGSEPAIGVLGDDLGVPQGTRYNYNGYLSFISQDIVGSTNLDAKLYYQDFQTIYGYSGYFYEGGQSTITSTKKGARINLETPFQFNPAVSGHLIYGMDLLNDITAQKLVDGRVWAPEMDMWNTAGFAQLTFNLYDHIVAKGGARLEGIGITVPDYTTLRTGDGSSGGVDVKGGDINYDALVFNSGLRYRRYESFKPFVSYSQSFSISDLGRILRGATENTVSNVQSEAVIVNNYEVGFNSNLSPLFLKGSLFLSSSSLGSSYKEVDGVYQIVRAPERVYGFELAADMNISNAIRAGASYAYVEGKIDNDSDGTYEQFLPTNRIAPPKATFYLDYNPLSRFSASLQGRIMGSRKHFEPTEDGSYGYGLAPVDGHFLANLYSSYEISRNTTLKLGIENLLNRDYYTVISQWYGRDDTYVKGNGINYTLTLSVNL
ncbi:TonB-dependent receptor [Fodinibius sediminis]|uniref:Iron complex outermembrane recepter protein n=1 Tax=Fodinibius sediminis TaxID=1214077 RepID=A0A521CLE8_9BACT|nr:TonB-dependent receptor [Fodinibius sediminis]SMO60254.1 iron complex outermembrane recepter protein [Fodinibius sediminis]